MTTIDISLLEKIIDPNKIILDPSTLSKSYLQNTLGIARNIVCALQIDNQNEIIKVIHFANQHKLSIYPISTGNNWGYGCSIPTLDNCIILDLRKMNKIIDFDIQNGIVTLEPGVTQKQLYDFLTTHSYDYLVPTTGAGPTCSIIGNILERGYGLAPICDHSKSVHALEAILPDGNIYNGSLPSSCSYLNTLYHWNIGPQIDGIMLQSNFAVITKMSIRLFPKPKQTELITIFSYDVTISKELISLLKEIQHEIGSDHMSNITLMNSHRFLKFSQTKKNKNFLFKKNLIPTWLVFFSIYGNKEIIRAIKSTIKKNIKKLPRKHPYIYFSMKKYYLVNIFFKFFNYLDITILKSYLYFTNAALQAFAGIPSQDGLKLVYNNVASQGQEILNPSTDQCGIIWFSPLIPLDALQIDKFFSIATRLLKKYYRESYVSFTTISPFVAFASIPILYDKANEADQKLAYKCYSDLLKESLESGYHPHRLGIQSMPDSLDLLNNNYWKLVQKLKIALDPNNVISPGRYCFNITNENL